MGTCKDTGTHLTQVGVLALGLSSPSGSFNLASIENVNGFGERPLPSEFSSSLSVQTWESCKRGWARVTSAVWVEGAECTGKASMASELFGFRAPGIFSS